MTPRVVLDTPVVLGALLAGDGALMSLRHAWQQTHCQPLVSRATAAELIRVLGYPAFKLAPEEQRELLADHLPYATVIDLPVKLPRLPAGHDSQGAPFLQLAVVGKADYLVTLAQSLSVLAGQFLCPIVSPDTFLSRIAAL